VWVAVLFLGTASVAVGQDLVQLESPPSRKFLPKGWIRGYSEFSVAPPHNEPDLDRCLATAGSFGGSQAHCSAFARFVAGGYVEIQPLGSGMFRRVFLFTEPHVFLGSNVPQFNYTFSAAPMALDRSVGVGIELPRNFELRLTQHRVQWMGRYGDNLGKADLGKTGPLGLYTTVSARWYFGGYKPRQ
jgi:hypothetical protein